MNLQLSTTLRADPSQVRSDLLHGDTEDLRRRRAIVGLSLVGMAAMTPVSLLQTGVVKHLPDPPLKGFHSDETNLSAPAYQFGVPDGTLALASLAANLPLAAWGSGDRARRQPWVPLAAAGKALLDAVGAGWYFYQMLSGKEPWCPYCITGAFANFGILALTMPEAREALAALAD
jgi:uncharacterized membrane protein